MVYLKKSPSLSLSQGHASEPPLRHDLCTQLRNSSFQALSQTQPNDQPTSNYSMTSTYWHMFLQQVIYLQSCQESSRTVWPWSASASPDLRQEEEAELLYKCCTHKQIIQIPCTLGPPILSPSKQMEHKDDVLYTSNSETFNSTQCHWLCTLEWGCFVRPCMLIHPGIKDVFFYPKTKH